jgi:hypothetical protein
VEGVSPVCLRFDEAVQSWTTEGVSLAGVPSRGDSPISCLAAQGTGTYAIAFSNSLLGFAPADEEARLDPLILSFSVGCGFVACMLCAVFVRAKHARGIFSETKNDIEKQMSDEIVRVKSEELDRYISKSRSFESSIWDLGSPNSIGKRRSVVIGTPVQSQSFESLPSSRSSNLPETDVCQARSLGSLSRGSLDWSDSEPEIEQGCDCGVASCLELPILTDISDWMGAKVDDDIERAVEHTQWPEPWGDSQELPRHSVRSTAIPRPSITRSAGIRKGVSLRVAGQKEDAAEDGDEAVPWWLQVIVQV